MKIWRFWRERQQSMQSGLHSRYLTGEALAMRVAIRHAEKRFWTYILYGLIRMPALLAHHKQMLCSACAASQELL